MIPNYISHTIKGREEVREAARPCAELPDKFFRDLDPVEVEQFRRWARDNFDPSMEPSGLWHPVVRREWLRLQGEFEGDGCRKGQL